MPDLADRARTLLDLHTAPEILVLANVWDVVSARVVAATDGVRALATASHSIAATFGYEDGENIPLDLHLDMVGRIVAAVDLPVTMDFEAGYGDAGETARRAIEVGRRRRQPRGPDEAARRRGRRRRGGAARRPRRRDRLRAQRPHRRLRPGRAGTPTGASSSSEAVRRGRAYLEAGAPVVFVPGRGRPRGDRGAGRRARAAEGSASSACRGTSLPVRELQELGVARVSTGPFTQRVALTALQDAAAEVVAGGVLPAGTRSLN